MRDNPGMDSRTLGQAALIEMREHDRALGVDPTAPSRVVSIGPPPAPPQSFFIERPDWDAEEREREALERERERQERTRIVEEELAQLPAEDTEPRMARPRLSAGRALLAEIRGAAT